MQNQDTYKTIINWKIEILDSFNLINSNKQKLLSQLEAMKINTDYTQDDINEITNIIIEINNLLTQI